MKRISEGYQKDSEKSIKEKNPNWKRLPRKKKKALAKEVLKKVPRGSGTCQSEVSTRIDSSRNLC